MRAPQGFGAANMGGADDQIVIRVSLDDSDLVRGVADLRNVLMQATQAFTQLRNAATQAGQASGRFAGMSTESARKMRDHISALKENESRTKALAIAQTKINTGAQLNAANQRLRVDRAHIKALIENRKRTEEAAQAAVKLAKAQESHRIGRMRELGMSLMGLRGVSSGWGGQTVGMVGNILSVASAFGSIGTGVGLVALVKFVDTVQAAIQALVKLGVVYAGVSATIATASIGIIAKVTQMAGVFEQLRVSVDAMVGSAKLGGQFFKALTEFARATPYQLTELAEAMKLLIAGRADVGKFLPIAGNIAAAFGATRENLMEVVSAIVRMQAGQYGESFEILRRFGIGQQRFRAEGVQFDRQGRPTGGTDPLEALFRIGGKQPFAGMMGVQAMTLFGRWSNVMDALQIAMADLGRSVLPKITGVLEKLEAALKKLPESEVWKTISDALKNFNFDSILTILMEIARGAIGALDIWQKLMPVFMDGFRGLLNAAKWIVKAAPMSIQGPVEEALGIVTHLAARGSAAADIATNRAYRHAGGFWTAQQIMNVLGAMESAGISQEGMMQLASSMATYGQIGVQRSNLALMNEPGWQTRKGQTAWRMYEQLFGGEVSPGIGDVKQIGRLMQRFLALRDVTTWGEAGQYAGIGPKTIHSAYKAINEFSAMLSGQGDKRGGIGGAMFPPLITDNTDATKENTEALKSLKDTYRIMGGGEIFGRGVPHLKTARWMGGVRDVSQGVVIQVMPSTGDRISRAVQEEIASVLRRAFGQYGIRVSSGVNY